MDEYKTNKDGHRTMQHHMTGYWFAYAKTQGDCFRGKGKTEDEAIQDSLKTNKKEL